ncbi:hypothetical protein Xmau_00309 [Xenorhabdus mauleonii]|uniref:DUF551 domain-containing protein n=1 Tax=Xenorhabdus mauleonii TaxID=351675 RepID=A0A1I3U5U7_9GAMM|nr:hypothetical protein [Xenorhabdus mauleonii]PHM45918.1 hypothetical protein Xmau_00309 [Xenorhabdus mauleonii]SFJ78390.1 hypothetical protein SAMN05421680_11624 [Xenorhabdus mauleonii]
MISIDNAQNNIGLPGHIDDGREWADWLLKKAGECKATQGIPWVSVQKRMPETDEPFPTLCLVYISLGSPPRADFSYWDADEKHWQQHENDKITHWCYLEDIPAPVIGVNHG